MKSIPNWEWRRVLLTQVLITSLSGVIAGVLQRSIYMMIFGAIQTPIVTLITATVSTAFFYYLFQIITEKQITYKNIFTVVLFANIPFFIFQIISVIFPAILLIGLAFTAFLLIVGFVQNFELPRKLISRLVAALYIVFVVTYGIAWWSNYSSNNKWHSDSEKAPEVQLGE